MAVSLAELESLPETELETMHESEFEFELNPVRKVYPDALMEHMAHMVMEAESEEWMGSRSINPGPGPPA